MNRSRFTSPMRTPLLSVVIPTCNRNDLLARCLAPLAPERQHLKSDVYEVIVSDDSSNTTAQDLVRRRFPWALWVPGPRRGPAANRNHGAFTARGQYVVFTDDDCVPSASWLAAFSSAAIRSDSAVFEGRTTCDNGIPSPRYHAPVNHDGGWLWSCNMMVRRDTFTNIGGFDERFPYPHMEDAELRERIRDHRLQIAFVPDAVVDHPARRLAWGRSLARMQESEILFHALRGERTSVARYLYRLARHRAGHIYESPFGADTVSAIASAVVEIAYVASSVRAWRKRYAGHSTLQLEHSPRSSTGTLS